MSTNRIRQQAILRIVREQAHALEKTGHWRPVKAGAKANAKTTGR